MLVLTLASCVSCTCTVSLHSVPMLLSEVFVCLCTDLCVCVCVCVCVCCVQYFDNCKAISSSPASYDTVAAKRLWDVSEELTKVQAKVPAGKR